MDYVKDLESGSSPKIRKAAQSIIKNNLSGYCTYLLNALTKEIEKPKAWQTQCQLIKAIGVTNCENALPFLKELVDKDHKHTVLYRELAFSILMLENTSTLNLDFLFESIKKGNDLQISGACSAILYKKVIPKQEDIKKIIAGISPYTEDEGIIITPRCYIAAVAYLWPKNEVHDFLESCQKSSFAGLVEIAQDSLLGNESKVQLI
mgnify:CR=1 FL=1